MESNTSTSLQRRLVKGLIAFLGLLALLAAGYTWLTLTYVYSSGERAGFLQKLSKKGWVCKTWEGELSLVAMPGAAPEKFFFSVRDESVAEKLNAAAGQRVVLLYEQHLGIPSNCFGETEYFVTGLRPLSP